VKLFDWVIARAHQRGWEDALKYAWGPVESNRHLAGGSDVARLGSLRELQRDLAKPDEHPADTELVDGAWWPSR
jgi:hypothetical protein